MDTEEYQFYSSLHRFNWLKLPSLGGRLSDNLVKVLTDGYFLSATKAGGLLSPLIFLLGIIWGWQHFDFHYLYTESFWFLLLAVILGSLSSQLGLLFSLGFIIGNSFLSDINFGEKSFFIKFAAQSVSYLQLLLLTTVRAVTIKYLASEISFSWLKNRVQKLILPIITYLLLTYFFILYWLMMAPLLNQPAFTWPGFEPSESSSLIIQKNFYWLILAGVITAIVRLYLQFRLSMDPSLETFFRTYELNIKNISSQRTIASKTNPWIRFFMYAAISLFTIAGLFDSWVPVIIVFVLYFFFYCMRVGFIPWPSWFYKWAATAGKVPAILKLLTGTIIIYLVTRFAVADIINIESSRTLAVSVTVLLGLLIFFLINPAVIKKNA